MQKAFTFREKRDKLEMEVFMSIWTTLGQHWFRVKSFNGRKYTGKRLKFTTFNSAEGDAKSRSEQFQRQYAVYYKGQRLAVYLSGACVERVENQVVIVNNWLAGTVNGMVSDYGTSFNIAEYSLEPHPCPYCGCWNSINEHTCERCLANLMERNVIALSKVFA